MNQTFEKSLRMARMMTIMAAAAVGFIVWLLGFSPAATELTAAIGGAAGSTGGVGAFRLIFWAVAVLVAAAFFWLRRRTPAPERLWQTFVVSMGLGELVGVFGAFLFAITRNKLDLILVVLSAALLAFNFPRQDRWEEAANSARNQG